MSLKEIRAPRGPKLSCKGWGQEAALRMLMNNLDPEVAEDWRQLVVYGGSGKAARSWESFDAIAAALRRLEDDQTLTVQSGKPSGVFRTHPDAPRVLIANSNLVPRWATPEQFRDLEERGLIMFGQMTAGSWIYIGTQGILQGTFETFAALARQVFGGSLAGRIVLTAGLGGMGGAQPLAITMNGGVALVVEVDPARIRRRVRSGYCDTWVDDLDEAVRMARDKAQAREPFSIGLLGNAAETHRMFLKKGLIPDVVTDQTSAHDLLHGYVPHGMSLEAALELRRAKPDEHVRRARESLVAHCGAILQMRRQGAHAFDYGNNLRGQAHAAGLADAFTFPGFVQAYIRPLFCEGKGPFRWVALSGDPADIAATDDLVLRLFPQDANLARWIPMARTRVPSQGLPARICWLGQGQRARFGLAINDLVRKGILKAPVVIGRDHLDCGSVASPYRETEGMRDGSDAIADWPLLNALLNAVSGATWVSIHSGGGVGVGHSVHAGQVIVADGTREAARRLERVLTNDPASGIVRHADAGYERAIEVAREHGIGLPSMETGPARPGQKPATRRRPVREVHPPDGHRRARSAGRGSRG